MTSSADEGAISQRIAAIAATVAAGREALLYESVYLPVDSLLHVGTEGQGIRLGGGSYEALTDRFDIGTIQALGERGWEVIGVVPRTIGRGLMNQTQSASAFNMRLGTTWGGGMGGNVFGVYVLLQLRINAANLNASKREIEESLVRQLPAPAVKACPDCAEDVPIDTSRCPFCGRGFR